MKRWHKLLTITAISSMAAICCWIGGKSHIVTTVENASAETATISEITDDTSVILGEMERGASVKFNSDSESNGYRLRFRAKFDQENYDKLVIDDTKTVGFLIIPRNIIDSMPHSFLIAGSEGYAPNYVQTVVNRYKPNDPSAKTMIDFENSEEETLVNHDEKSGLYHYHGVIKLLEQNINRSFVGFGYIKTTSSDGTVTYETLPYGDSLDNISRSIAYVASKTYAVFENDLNAVQQQDCTWVIQDAINLAATGSVLGEMSQNEHGEAIYNDVPFDIEGFSEGVNNIYRTQETELNVVGKPDLYVNYLILEADHEKSQTDTPIEDSTLIENGARIVEIDSDVLSALRTGDVTLMASIGGNFESKKKIRVNTEKYHGELGFAVGADPEDVAMGTEKEFAVLEDDDNDGWYSSYFNPNDDKSYYKNRIYVLPLFEENSIHNLTYVKANFSYYSFDMKYTGETDLRFWTGGDYSVLVTQDGEWFYNSPEEVGLWENPVPDGTIYVYNMMGELQNGNALLSNTVYTVYVKVEDSANMENLGFGCGLVTTETNLFVRNPQCTKAFCEPSADREPLSGFAYGDDCQALTKTDGWYEQTFTGDIWAQRIYGWDAMQLSGIGAYDEHLSYGFTIKFDKIAINNIQSLTTWDGTDNVSSDRTFTDVSGNVVAETDLQPNVEYVVVMGINGEKGNNSYGFSLNAGTGWVKSAFFDINPVFKSMIVKEYTANIVKTQFAYGEAFVFDGTLTATYTDGREEINMFEIDASAYNANVAGSYTIILRFGDKTHLYEVTVLQRAVIEYRLNITKTVYKLGEAFVFGGTVTTVYSDGSEELYNGYTIDTLYNSNVAGTYKVTIHYGNNNEQSYTYDVTVEE